MRRSHWLFAIGLAVLAGCGDEAIAPSSPEDARAMLAIAPDFTADKLAAEIGLEPGQMAAFEARLNELHATLQDVHGLLPAQGEDVSALESDPTFKAAMERLHEKHHALLEGLTADQRDRFIHHVHDRLQAHLDADGHDPSGHGLRDIAERLHGARGH